MSVEVSPLKYKHAFDRIHTVSKLIEVSQNYKTPLFLTFIDLKKAFDSLETEEVMELFDDNLLQECHNLSSTPMTYKGRGMKYRSLLWEYTKQVEYSAIDEETYQKCGSATALLQSSMRQIKEARENLQELYNEVRDAYKNCKNKSERKDLMIEMEQIEEESQLQSVIAEANDLSFMLTAHLDETKNMRENMEIKLGYMSLKPQRDDNVSNEENEERDGEIDNTNENCVRDTTMPSCSQDTSNSASTRNSGTVKRTLRSIKLPQATLPKFYGNSDDFPRILGHF
ncbi:hypothetical protein RB195_018951 [Necator americanus]|uniref:Reverse transcriptase domain-containing protein n=1 Tax=Necator americanus TaxID=51031 RepID=A0ABR1CDJ8_NECAM